MTPTQLNHTAAVLAQMLTFEQPADVVLSNYLRNHRKLGRNDRHEIAETACATIKKLPPRCAAPPCNRAKPPLPRLFSGAA